MKQTKQNRRYKQKLADDSGFDGGSSIAVQKVEFDYDAVDPQELPADVGLTREEMEPLLKERGLSRTSRVVVLARVYEKKTFRKIGAEHGKTGAWAHKIWKRNYTHLSVRKAPRRTTEAPEPEELPPEPLRQAMVKLIHELDNYMSAALAAAPGTVRVEPESGLRAHFARPAATDLGHVAAGLAWLGLAPDATEYEQAVAAVILWPRLLRHPEAGPPLAEKIAELMQAARYGGTVEKTAARKMLAALTRYQRGNRCPIPNSFLGSESLSILVTVVDLQRAWRKRGCERPEETREARVEGVREQFGSVADGFSDHELLGILQGDPMDASARLAERATRIAAESFKRAWRGMPEVEEFYKTRSLIYA